MEKIPSQLKHPPLFEISDAKIDSQEINLRLYKIFNELPRLWDDYAVQVVKLAGEESISKTQMELILNKISLRPEAFLEYEKEYFEENFDEIVRIAKERGSHDDY